jgi:AraC-like DNA-binding protein
VLLGEKDLSYGPGQSLLTTVDLPVSYHVTRATATDPYLGMMLKFDRILITQVASKIEAVRPGKTAAFEPIWIQRLDAPVLDALHWLISLLDEPMLILQLAPLIQQELIVRLLTGPHAFHLWRLVNAAGPTQQLARAVTWIRQHFTEAMRVEDLAECAKMSPITFRQHFRTITGMSSVQFLKLLRLQEARQLMLDQNMVLGVQAPSLATKARRSSIANTGDCLRRLRKQTFVEFCLNDAFCFRVHRIDVTGSARRFACYSSLIHA